jgi:hypothetical protein
MIRHRLPPFWQIFYRFKNPPDNNPQFYFVPKVDGFCNETVHFTVVQYSMKPLSCKDYNRFTIKFQVLQAPIF